MLHRFLVLFTLMACVVCGKPIKPKAAPKKETSVDLIVVYKQERLLALYKNDDVIRTYEIALGFQPEGHKRFEGDGRTPEGSYKIVERRIHPTFHKSLKISYPNKADIAYAKSRGRSPGGEILIHGLKNQYWFVGGFHNLIDWTQGCIAVSNREMDEIYNLVQVGTPILIFKNMDSAKKLDFSR